jgi:aryl-alcohol dehydrogenase-like predicted oxidoreductase
MMFGAWGEPDHDESIRIIHAALDAGIHFIDTADVYSAGESEEIVGKALEGRRDDVVLATKLYMPIGDDADPNRRGTSRRWIVQEVENSLRRLATDWIDLYQIHRPTPDTDLDETLGALTDLVHQDKVRYIGHSTYPASLIVEAQWTARDRRLQRFVSEQPPYSILTRAIEAEVLPTCAKYGMAVIPWSPLQGGWLSGRYRKDADNEGPKSEARRRLTNRYDLSLPENQRKLDAAEQLAQLADEAGVTLIQLALAFVLDHGRHGADHRPAHAGASREPARGGGRGPRRRRTRPHRRDRPSGHQPQPRRWWLGQPRAPAGRSSPWSRPYPASPSRPACPSRDAPSCHSGAAVLWREVQMVLDQGVDGGDRPSADRDRSGRHASRGARSRADPPCADRGHGSLSKSRGCRPGRAGGGACQRRGPRIVRVPVERSSARVR